MCDWHLNMPPLVTIAQNKLFEESQNSTGKIGGWLVYQ